MDEDDIGEERGVEMIPTTFVNQFMRMASRYQERNIMIE